MGGETEEESHRDRSRHKGHLGSRHRRRPRPFHPHLQPRPLPPPDLYQEEGGELSEGPHQRNPRQGRQKGQRAPLRTAPPTVHTDQGRPEALPQADREDRQDDRRTPEGEGRRDQAPRLVHPDDPRQREGDDGGQAGGEGSPGEGVHPQGDHLDSRGRDLHSEGRDREGPGEHPETVRGQRGRERRVQGDCQRRPGDPEAARAGH
mmetsp:Transcript_17200/g.34873  ORF Transcript_17200/g.34873 Transcript_17200/m.34873 type:complete len:205 (-) Transcript_17200:1136-1750(-)